MGYARANSRNCSIRIEDANGLGMTIGPGPGDWTVDPINAENASAVRVMDRGRYDGHVITDDLEQSGSITVQMRNEAQTSATAPRVQDLLLRRGFFAGAVSTGVYDTPMLWRLIHTFESDAGPQRRVFPRVHLQHSLAESTESNTITINYTNNGAPTT